MSMEDAKAAVKTYLDANLNTQLSTIETARNVTIPRPYEIVTSFAKTKQYPNISIVPATTAFEYGEVDEFLNPWNDHAIGIMIAHAGGAQANVQDTLIRYVEAIETLVTGSRTRYSLGGLVEIVQLVDVEYSITAADEDRAAIQITVIELIVRELQT